MQNLKPNLIVERTFNFSIMIIKYCDELEGEKRFIVARQLLRCGTGIGASVREAQNAESKKDFIHKMKIAAKEADECEYWLSICIKAFEHKAAFNLLTEIKEIIKIISRIIATSKNNLKEQSFSN